MSNITGTADSDALSGTGGDDVIQAAGGTDSIYASPGHDVIDGGSGEDTFYVYLDRSPFVSATGPRTYTVANDRVSDSSGTLDTRFANIERVDISVNATYANIFDASSFTGKNGVWLTAGSGNDRLTGSAGDDHLLPGTGDNIVDGGPGFDVVFLDFSSQTAGINLDLSNSSVVNAITRGGVAAGSITNVEQIHFTGGAGNDGATGGSFYDSLSGGAGNDALHGGGEGDTLDGGAGSDLLDGGSGLDTADYAGADAGIAIDLNLQGVAQDTGGSGNDTLISIENMDGSAYSDRLTGDANANVIGDSQGGNDQIWGNGGQDYLYVGRSGGAATTVMLSGGSDNDTLIFSGATRYSDTATLDGGDGADTIVASGLGSGLILAGNGNDQVTVDTLGGQFQITLGGGSDTLTLAATEGGFRAESAIVVTDFKAGDSGDILKLNEWLSGGALINDPSLKGHLRLLQSGTSTLLQADRDGGGDHYTTLVTFQNTAVTAFVSSNFSSNFSGYSPDGLVNVVTGTNGADSLSGSPGDDQITAKGGNDSIDMSFGHDMVDGGSGDSDNLYLHVNTLPTPPADGIISYLITSDHITDSLGLFDTTFQNIEYVYFNINKFVPLLDSYDYNVDASGFAGRGIWLTSGSGNDRLIGSSGDDRISASSGSNFIDAGAGTDWLDVSAQGPNAAINVINGGSGYDSLTLNFASLTEDIVLDISNAASMNTIMAAGAAAGSVTNVERIDYYYGGSGSDTVTGGASGNVLYGGDGNDILRGGGGHDVFWGGSGSDILDGAGGSFDYAIYSDAIAGVRIDFHLQGIAQDTGGSGYDTLIGIEQVSGSAFSDVLIGDDASNTLIDDGGGDDHLFGNGGADLLLVYRYDVPATTVLLSGGDGNDDVRFESMFGYLHDITADGGDGDDQISVFGVSSATILAGSGQDSIAIDALGGQFTIELGSGSDNITFIAPSSGDPHGISIVTVTDFTAGDAGDVLALDAVLATALTNYSYMAGVTNPFVDGHLRLVQSGSSTLLQIDRNGGNDSYATLVTFLNTTATAFTEYNFRDLIPTVGPNQISGDDTGNVLNGTPGNDEIAGLGGDDVLQGGLGNDILRGGTGIDTASYTGSTGGVQVSLAANGQQDTLSAGLDTLSQIENLTGSAFGDTLTGNFVTNVLLGGDGNDRLDGGEGADVLDGGAGDDVLIGGNGTDMASYAPSLAAVSVSLAVTTAQATGGAGSDTLIAVENLTGSSFADTLTGDAAANAIDGGDGNDIINGGLGDDVLAGGAGIDMLSYADATSGVRVSLALTAAQNTLAAGMDVLSGFENITGSEYGDQLTGDGGNNVLVGLAGNDQLTGGGGDDLLIGGNGNDIMTGGNGIDTVTYADASAGISVSLAITTIQTTGVAGKDTLSGIENLTGSQFNDTLTGDDNANVIVGGLGSDAMKGGGGNDRIFADGNDWIDGGAGIDTLNLDLTASTTAVVANLAAAFSGGTSTINGHAFTGIEQYLQINGSAFGDTINVGDASQGFDGIISYDGNPGVYGGAGNDVLTGGASTNYLFGGDGNDTLSGGGGNDYLDGGTGVDALDGGDGQDYAYLDFGGVTGDIVLINGGVAGTVYTQTINGVAASTIANIESESLYGGSGNDILGARFTGVGSASFLGNAGTDTIVIDFGASAVVANSTAADMIVDSLGGVSGTINYAGFESLFYTAGAGGGAIGGTAGADRLTGGAGADNLSGKDGDDVLDGQAGDDVLVGGDGGSPLNGGDMLLGGDGNDTIFGGDGAGRDQLIGGAGDDTLNAGEGNDFLVGGTGLDVMDGGTGDDVLEIDKTAEVVAGEIYTGGPGQDFLAISSEAKIDLSVVTISGIEVLSSGVGARIGLSSAQLDAFTTIAVDGELTLTTGGTADLSDAAVFTPVFNLSNFGNVLKLTVLPISATAYTVNGGIGADTVVGGALGDTLSGGAGNDNLNGGAGDDLIIGGSGNDMLAGGAGIDTVAYTDATNGVRVNLALTTIQGTAAGGNDTLSGFENLTGSNFGDQLTGDAGNNVIRGGLGNDNLDGGDGNDVLIGGAGSDKLTGGNGIDTASYEDSAAGVTVSLAIVGTQATIGSGTDTLTGIENLTGSALADKLTGDAGNNVITGSDGNDTLNGGLGNDTLDGGAGIDIASYAGASNGVKVTLGISTPQSTAAGGKDMLISIEGVEGSSFGDQLIGSAGDDIIYGRDGNDTIVAGDGNDLVLGGTGSDNMSAGAGIDTVSYADAIAAVTVSLAITAQQGTAGSGNDTLSGFENLIGSNYNDILTGDAGANAISGGAGHDTIIGGLGDDILDGGLGTDTASYASAAAGVTVSLAITGIQSTISAGSDTLSGFENLTGSVFADTLTGDAGANKINAGAGNDHVDGGAGDDIILGSLGDDVLAGGDGSDTLSYEDATSAVVVSLALGLTGQNTGPSGFDTFSGFENLAGSAFADTLTGDDFANILSGGAANDKLFGGLGNDALLGGAGSDLLTGGAGTDTLTGGTSGDRFILTAASDSSVGSDDVITDFNHAEKDRIDVSGIYSGTFSFLGLGDFTGHAGQLHFGASGTDLLVSGDIDGDSRADFEIKLIGIATLDATDFVL